MSSVGEKWRGAKSRAAQSGVPDLEAHVDFCRRSEACGIDSVLTAFGFHRADPIVLASALGVLTTKIKFMIAVRSGNCSPTVLGPAGEHVICSDERPDLPERSGRPHAQRTTRVTAIFSLTMTAMPEQTSF